MALDQTVKTIDSILYDLIQHMAKMHFIQFDFKAVLNRNWYFVRFDAPQFLTSRPLS